MGDGKRHTDKLGGFVLEKAHSGQIRQRRVLLFSTLNGSSNLMEEIGAQKWINHQRKYYKKGHEVERLYSRPKPRALSGPSNRELSKRGRQ